MSFGKVGGGRRDLASLGGNMQGAAESAIRGNISPAAGLAGGALIAFLVFAPLFLSVPQLDLAVAHLFFAKGAGFFGPNGSVGDLRALFKLLYVFACAVALGGLVASLFGWATVRGFSRAKWLFLVLCLSIGPGVVCNLVLKDEWGRARPHQITAFGGDKSFTPALVPAAECQSNCSFTCGEASSIYMIFFALALVMRRRSGALIATGVALGSIAGLIRMAQGGHFLSDVVFAGVTMALVAAVLHQLLEGGWLAVKPASQINWRLAQPFHSSQVPQ